MKEEHGFKSEMSFLHILSVPAIRSALGGFTFERHNLQSSRKKSQLGKSMPPQDWLVGKPMAHCLDG